MCVYVCITYHTCVFVFYYCILSFISMSLEYHVELCQSKELEDNIVKPKHIIRRKLWGKKLRPHKRGPLDAGGMKKFEKSPGLFGWLT